MNETNDNEKRKLFVYTVIISALTAVSVFLPLYFGVGGRDVRLNGVDTGIFNMLMNLDLTVFTNLQYMICMIIAGWPMLAFGVAAVAIGVTAFIRNDENQIAVYKKLNLGCLICSLTYSLFGIIDMIVGFAFKSYVLPLNWIYSIPVAFLFIGFIRHNANLTAGESVAPSQKSKITVLSTIVASAVVVSLSIGLGLGFSNSEGKTVVRDGISYQFQTVHYSYAGGRGTLNGYVVTGAENVNTEKLVIPNSINGDSVIAIGDFALTEIPCREVLLPGSIKTIGWCAFQSCPNLEKVVAPVNLIGDLAFNECMSLVSIITSAYEIGESAFASCSNLQSVVCPNIRTIGRDVFHDCVNLEEFDFASNLESIGHGAFAKTGIASLTLANTRVSTIGAGAFMDCDKLTTADLGRNIKAIEAEAFYDCDNLTSVTIGNQVQEIGQDAFGNCEKLTSVTYSDYSITWQPSQTTVILPRSIKEISDISGTIYYSGSKEDWDKVNKLDWHNTVYYYSSSNPYEQNPDSQDLYWHSVNGVPAVWEKSSTVIRG